VRVIANENSTVYKTWKYVSDHRAESVHPVVGEVSTHNDMPKGAGGVHGGTGERADDQDVGAHDESDGNGSDGAQISLLQVGCVGIDDVYKHECDNDIHHHALAGAQKSWPVSSYIVYTNPSNPNIESRTRTIAHLMWNHKERREETSWHWNNMIDWS
jgi:hypothetical protein